MLTLVSTEKKAIPKEERTHVVISQVWKKRIQRIPRCGNTTDQMVVERLLEAGYAALGYEKNWTVTGAFRGTGRVPAGSTPKGAA